MVDNEQATTEAQPAKRRRRSRTADQASALDVAHKARISRMQTAGRPLPGFPTTAEELVDVWDVPQEDVYGVSVKISRQKAGDQNVELIASVPVVEYDLAAIAGRYGPGLYFISGAQGKYRMNAAKMHISPEMAKENGYGRLPTTAQDVKAAETLRNAAQGPTDPVDLLASIERLVERKLQESRPVQQPVVGGSMELQMASMFKGFELFATMEDKVLQMAERRAGMLAGKIVNAEEPEGGDMWSSIMKAITSETGMKIVGSFLNRSQEPVVVQTPQAAAPQALPMETKPMPQLPPITREQGQAIAPAVALLKPLSGLLVTAAKNDTRSAKEAADELAGFVPPHAYESTVALDDLVKEKGPAVLMAIHEEMGTPRWAELLSEIVKKLTEPSDE